MDKDKQLIGRNIAGKFALEAFLGGGSMGAVYRARHLQLETPVAIKVMHPELSRDEQFAARFLREAKTTFRIDHPNSLRVIDYGEEPDGLLYIAMEFLDGRDLLEVIRQEWPLSNARVADIVMQALGALAAAHDLGILHRDLKPENIMVLTKIDDEGQPRDLVKVCDFGIAKVMLKPTDAVSMSGPKITSRGMVVGTPEYMSPEQGRGEELDARSDLYSIGVILFQLLTRKLPFVADTPLAVMLKQVTDNPPLPSSIVPSVDARLEAICLRALQKRPDQRFLSAREMRSELRAISEGGSNPVLPGISVPITNVPYEPMRSGAPTLVGTDSHSSANALSKSITTKKVAEEAHSLPPPQRSSSWLFLGIALLGVAGSAAFYLVKFGRSNVQPALDPPVVVSVAPSTSAPLPTVSAVPSVWKTTDPAITAETALPLAVSAAPSSSHAKKIPGHNGTGTISTTASTTAPSTHPSSTSTAAANGSVSDTEAGYTPKNAHVDIGKVTGGTKAQVHKAVPLAFLSACYREDLQGITHRPPPAVVALSLETDAVGRVTKHGVSGAWAAQHPADLARCIENHLESGGTMPGITAPTRITAELKFNPD